MSAPEALGRLRRVRRIGVGGFASVWLYHDTDLKSHVAVKALADNWAQRADVRERFLNEAQLLRATDSAHVVQVYDIGELPDQTPYFVMGFADKGTVADLIHDEPPALATTVDLVNQAAQGIADLHATGVIHRDIKPSNLLLRSDRMRGRRLLVADLGVAKAMMYASGMTQVVGTPAYMAPEQSEPGGPVDARADVHALGAVAYQLLTGRVVREGTLYGRRDAEAPDPPSAVADVPEALDDAVLRAVALDPVERWPDPLSFAAALRDAVGTTDETESATWQPSGADTTIRVARSTPTSTPPLKHRPRKAWLVAGLVAVLVGAVAVGGYLLGPWGDPEAGTPADPGDYCTVLQEDWDRIASTGGTAPDDYAVITDAVHRIRTAAPTGVEQRWAAVDDPLQDFRTVIEELDISWDDLTDDELDAEDRASAVGAMNRLSQRLDGVDLNAIAAVDTRERCGFVPRRIDIG
ncbi:serine/threonine-protein kinase [Solicola gregarius]|uniref:non-specific serine/threonine protein kinase n=1 Tax=Solicola gregarius TaxID=2908642 RepID=A0AA46TF24_9ACTN|nr:serine/threonine-protein kinase [Solicola gregarius]UYM03383.1 serine/threonine protein kinase [Solicola gregarius]